MKLIDIIAAKDMDLGCLFAGGPGSGCHGDNCGRPAGVHPEMHDVLIKKGYQFDKVLPSGNAVYGKSNGERVVTRNSEGVSNSRPGALNEAGGWKHTTSDEKAASGKGVKTLSSHLGGGQPEVSKPEVSKPEVSKPEVSKPEVSKPYGQRLDSISGKAEAKVTELLTKYPLEKARQFNLAQNNNWAIAIEKGMNPIQAAKDKGVYPELAAHLGFTPDDLKLLHGALQGWSGTDLSGKVKIWQAGQSVVTGKCCPDKFAQTLEMEHVITKNVLKEQYGDAVALYRGLSGKVADDLASAARKGREIEYNGIAAESWTNAKSVASEFGHVQIQLKIPVDYVITSERTNPSAFSEYAHEHEHIVAFPSKVIRLKATDITAGQQKQSTVVDVTGKDQQDWLHRTGRRKAAMSKQLIIKLKIISKKQQ